MTDPAIKKLFDDYEKAFSALDVPKNAEMFSDTFISAGPKGAIARSKAEFVQLAHKASEFYRSVGQKGAKILALDEVPISGEYLMVKARWAAFFEKLGDKPVEFDVSYLVHKREPRPKIILFIAHQDEEQAMKDLGLLA